MSKKYFSHVDALRAIAVLIVIMFHLDFTYLPGGYVGVDIFFVISGFLIVGVLKKELDNTSSLNFTNFYIRRFKRLTPALFVTLLFTFLFASIVFSPAHLQRIGGALTSAFFGVSNVFFWLEADYFDTSAKLKPFLHTWSLSVEWQFYFILPFVMYLFYKNNIKKWFLLFLILAILGSLFLNYAFADGKSLLTNYIFFLVELVNNGKSTLFYLLPFRIFEFAIGGGLVWLQFYKFRNKLIYDVLFWLGLTLIAYSVVVFDETYLFPYWFALVPCFGAALIIYSGGEALTGRIINNKIFVGVGLISYSLYLVHWPLIVFWSYLAENGIRVNSNKVSILVVSFMLAFLLYRYVEQPARSSSFFSNKPIYRLISLTGCILLVAASVHAYKTDGWQWRVGTTLVNVERMGNATDFHKRYYGGAGYPNYGGVNTKLPPDLILLGDSHGRHYAEGLFKVVAEPNQLSLYMASGISCFHLPSFTRTTKGKEWDSLCPWGLHKALSYIDLSLTPPSMVIISHAWVSQMLLADLLDEQGVRRHVEVNIDHVIEGLLALKQKLGNVQLIVIGNVPGTGDHNLYDLFTRPRLLIFNEFNPTQYLFSIRNEHKEKERVNLALNSAAKKTGKFLFVDPFDYLCSEDRCRNTDEKNRLIYSDTGHLSVYGSMFLIKKIESKLMLLLNSK